MYTYLAVRQEVLDLNNVAAPIGDTELDLGAWVPADAHTVILVIEVKMTVLGAAGAWEVYVRKTVAQGDASASFGNATEEDSLGAQAHIPIAASKIRYQVAHPANALRLDINFYLLGYIE